MPASLKNPIARNMIDNVDTWFAVMASARRTKASWWSCSTVMPGEDPPIKVAFGKQDESIKAKGRRTVVKLMINIL